jgi:hypothetical protein
MNSTENQSLITLTPDLMAIADADVCYPNMPVAIFTQEMESLRETYLKDTDLYAQRNIDTAVLADSLDQAVGALRAAEIKWSEALSAQSSAQETWERLQEEAYDLRDEAVASLEYILDENTSAWEQLKEIRTGRGHADMILDLGKLVTLCRDTAEALTEIAFTEEMTNRLEELYTTLSDVYGKVTSDRRDINDPRDLRDRAFVYCKGIERDIKRAANLVLRKKPELLQQYRSEYRYRQNLKRDHRE